MALHRCPAGLSAIAACAIVALALPARAQDIEPRAYSNAPIGVNFLIAGYAYTRGGLAFDSSLPITNPDLRTSSAVVGFATVLDLWGKSAKFDAIVPYTFLSGTAEYQGEPVERKVDGFGEPGLSAVGQSVRGARADFAGVRGLGAGPDRRRQPSGVAPVEPVRQHQARQHRHQPLGVQAGDRRLEGARSLDAEVKAAAIVLHRQRRLLRRQPASQDPIYSIQGHLIYGFPSGIWVSVDATYFAGGRTTLNGVRNYDLQQNWRLGGTAAFPVDRANSVKLYASSGLSARTGNDYDLVGVAWQYRWGGGL